MAGLTLLSWGLADVPAGATSCSQIEQLNASNQNDTWTVGTAVDIDVTASPPTAIVGAWLANASGEAYVFVDSGGWTEQAILTPDSDSAFGVAVAVQGNLAVVGAPFDDDQDDDAGAIYVFRRTGTTWGSPTKLFATDPGMSPDYFWDLFGSAVDIDGNTIVASAAWDDDAGTLAGAAYIFFWDGTSWSQQAKLTGSGCTGGERFGWDVAISGDRVVVGAPWGSQAYAFSRSGTTWTEEEQLHDLLASEVALGYSVGISGTKEVVGDPGDADNGALAGAVHVFSRSGSTWSAQQKLVACDGAAGDRLGASSDIDASMIVAGAPEVGSSAGSAYVFTTDGATWMQHDELTPTGGSSSSDAYGTSAAISGGMPIVGAPGDDLGGDTDAGSAYLFECGEAFPCSAGRRDAFDECILVDTMPLAPATACAPVSYTWQAIECWGLFGEPPVLTAVGTAGACIHDANTLNATFCFDADATCVTWCDFELTVTDGANNTCVSQVTVDVNSYREAGHCAGTCGGSDLPDDCAFCL